ncbi:phosphatidylinositol-3,5-bisphosphate 5-phosphatase [Hypoxylon texense]
MEPKQLEERQTLDDQNKCKTTSQTESLPAGDQDAREETDALEVHRPWANHLLTLDSRFQKEDWWKTEGHHEDTVGRWAVQSMANEPYHNVKSVIGQTQEEHIKFPSSQSSPPSETAATSGSG